MSGAARGDPIDNWLAEVGSRLPGPAGARAEILAELRDGLFEAAEANRKGGRGRGEAVELALRQFGDAPALAASFWPEMAAARARRVVLVLFATGPIVAALWVSALRSRGPGATEGLFDSGPAHVAAALLIAMAIGCGIWTLVATGRATRWLAMAPQMPLLGATATGGIAVLSDLALLSMLSARLVSFPGTVHQVALGAAVLASGTRLIFTSRASWSCFAMRMNAVARPANPAGLGRAT
jgi:hypothetical protein